MVHDVKLWEDLWYDTYASEAQSVRSSLDVFMLRYYLQSCKQVVGYVQLAAAQFSAGSPLLRSVWDFNYHILSVQTPGGCCTK